MSCNECWENDSGKYYEKARVYGAIACGFRKALEEIAKEGSEPAAYIARKALEWRHCDMGGVPMADVMAFGEVLKADRKKTKRVK